MKKLIAHSIVLNESGKLSGLTYGKPDELYFYSGFKHSDFTKSLINFFDNNREIQIIDILIKEKCLIILRSDGEASLPFDTSADYKIYLYLRNSRGGLTLLREV